MCVHNSIYMWVLYLTVLTVSQSFLVRQKAKDLIAFLQDDERLRDARKNARKTRDKYVGISSADTSERYSEFFFKYNMCVITVMCGKCVCDVW